MKLRIISAAVALLATCMYLLAGNNCGSRIVYASEAGVVLDSDVYLGGGTDMTDRIQAILDMAPIWGRLHFVMDGAALISKPLRIHSNTTVECPDKSCGFFLADGSDCSCITNANPSMGEISDRNITLSGGVYNNNSPGQKHHREGPGADYVLSSWVYGMEFYGVESLTVRDITIANQRTFAFTIANWKYVVMENVHIDRRVRPDAENQDGLHFFGPGSFLTLRNIYGNSGDDFIAIAPDEVDKVSSISDVVIDGVHLEDADQGIRILCDGEGTVDRVVVRNVTGTYRSFGFIVNPWFDGSGGNYGNIVFDNIDLRPLAPNYDYNEPFLFKFGGNIESVVLNNIHVHHPDFNHRLAIIGGGYMTGKPTDDTCPTHIGRLVVNGLYIDEDCREGTQLSYFLIKGGQVDLLSVNDAIIRRTYTEDKSGSLVNVIDGKLSEIRLSDCYAPCLKKMVEGGRKKVEKIYIR